MEATLLMNHADTPAHVAEVGNRGRDAKAPWEIPLRGWRDVLLRVASELGRDRVAFLAAAIAFYAMLALFPTLIAIVSLYGLLFDPSGVTQQLTLVSRLLPPEVALNIQQQALSIVQSSRTELTLGFGLSLVGALWSSSLGALALIRALNVAYNEVETRSFFQLRGLALVFALGLVLFVVITLSVLALAPGILALVGIDRTAQLPFRVLRWLALAATVPGVLTLAYRYAPNRRPARWQWVVVGAIVAAALWLMASSGLAVYVDHVMALNRTYGALSSGVVLMLWLYVSSFVVLVGAELNAELEHQTARDTTIGKGAREPGQRGAAKADSLGPVPESPKTAIQQQWRQIQGWVRPHRRPDGVSEDE
jgi:membrane protein